MTTLLMVILHETEDNLFKAGMVHTLVQILFSLVLVYVPSDGFNTADQRVEVSARSVVSEVANNSTLKWFTVHMFASTTILNALSMYTVFNILWIRFDTAFDMLFLVILGYFLMLILFYVAYLTAIYDIHSPLRIDSDTIVVGTKGVSPSDNMNVKMYDYKTKTFSQENVIFQHDTIVAMTEQLHCWEIGTFLHGEIVLHEYAFKDISCCGQKLYATLPLCTEYKVALYSIDRQKSLFCIGDIVKKEKGYYIHLFHTYTLKFFQFILKIAPAFDESNGTYRINVVENLRAHAQKKCHLVFLNRPYLVSVLYLIIFALVTGISIFLILSTMLTSAVEWWAFYIVELLFIGSIVVFALHVSTKKKVRLQNNKILQNPPTSTKRSGAVFPLEMYIGELSDTYEGTPCSWSNYWPPITSSKIATYPS